jgi:uncharacterized protein (TIGR03000 family)
MVSSRVTINAPEGAEIWVEGAKIRSGAHVFRTPPLDPEHQYRYTIRATWLGPDGKTVTRTRDVVFSPGRDVAVRFGSSEPLAPPPAPAPES